jgi:cobalamin biosynthesis protein CbiG
MIATTVQITMTAAGSSDLPRSRQVTIALPRDALAAAMAAAAAGTGVNAELGPRLVDDGYIRKQDGEPSNGRNQTYGGLSR